MIDGANENDNENENEYMKQQLTALASAWWAPLSINNKRIIYQQLNIDLRFRWTTNPREPNKQGMYDRFHTCPEYL